MAQDQHTPPAAFIASRHRNPLENTNLKPAINYTWAGVFAILAFLLFAGILVFQYLEWAHYEPFIPPQ